MTDDRYTPGTNLEIPGLEAILEYGDASKVKRDRIPGAMLINDQSRLDRARITQMDGLHDDPEGAETRQPNPDRHGERAGNMFYRGRTVGMTGRVEAGNISAMRSNWRRLRGQFGTSERDLLVHHPFEIGALVNEVPNPSLGTDGFGWAAPISTGGGTTSLLTGGNTEGIMKVGSLSVTSAPAATSLFTYSSLLDLTTGLPLIPEWDGEDVWMTACMKVQSATGTVSYIAIGATQWTYFSPGSTSLVHSVGQSVVYTPVTGTWYTLTARVPASVIASSTTHLTMFVNTVSSGAGTYNTRFFRCASVLLDPSAPNPTAYFDGDTPGFEWQGVARQSRTIGPTHAENKIQDPRFEDRIGTSRELSYWKAIGAAAVYTPLPSRSNQWSGDHVDGSVYVKAFKSVTSTAEWGVKATNSDGTSHYPAIERRIYRFSAKVKTLQKPASGTFNLAIAWLREDGTVISTHTSEIITLGEDEFSVVMTAPPRTCAAQALAQMTGSTDGGSVLEFFLSDPCFVDITDWDPGDFYGVGDPAEEAGNRRRIPRPFLLQKVRKTSDMKAPEQQSRNRAWRDFTMSLRASDPRVYCLDKRRRSYEMPLISQMKIAMQNPSSFNLSTAPAPVPTGATYSGQSIPSTVTWTKQATAPYVGGGTTPFGGVNFNLWPSGGNLISLPASPVLGRFYRSAEAYTYTEPRVIAGCSPVNRNAVLGGGAGLGLDPAAWGWTITRFQNPVGVYANEATVLIKRVSSTTWLELRWKPLTNAVVNAYKNTFTSNPLSSQPWAFELWCSHATNGTLATTRLATWDYVNTPPASVIGVPFNPVAKKAYLDVYLVGNVVNWGLWLDGYPGPIGLASTRKIESGSYTLPGGLAAVVGSSVAGQAGFAMKVDNPPTDSGVALWQNCALNPPFMHYLRFSNASELAPVLEVPVIGDSDTTPEIVLTGLMVNPVLSIQTPREDGSLDSHSIILEGTIASGEQLIIGNGKIIDGAGTNRYEMLQPGFHVPMLQPGINYVTLSAIDWNESLGENMSISWRDALS